MSEPNKLQEAVQESFAKHFYPDDDFTLLVSDNYLSKFLDLPSDLKKQLEPWRRYCMAQMLGSPADDASAGGPGTPDGPSRQPRPRLSFEYQERVADTYIRLQVSRSYAGRAWSITGRWTAPESWRSNATRRRQIGKNYKKRAEAALKASDWAPRREYALLPSGTPVLFSFADIVGATHELVFKQAEGPEHGLVLVSGRTASGKSEVARGLVWQLMRDKVIDNPKRRPHLVTYEDPIEKYFLPIDEWKWLVSENPKVFEHDRTLDYTPRQKHRDCRNLTEVVSGALRQTPAVLYVGEIRTNDEFVQAMEFAGTGHLVVATAHAGNLVESVGRVLDAVGAHDANMRAMYVPRILAVVHMSLVKSEVNLGRKAPQTIGGFVPALYRRTSRGMQNLVADGLFSLMPGYARDQTEAKSMGSLGRQFMAECLSVGVAKAPDKRFRADDGSSRLASAFNPKQWRSLANWNAGGTVASAVSGRRLIDVALELDVHGR